ncbi:MAG: Nicotinamide-nucleotide amidohydrolase PncC [Chlamydiae bacterium]|nr:Nicotinamide-nucleotide amidohydrolase PncC [Chlamydiota bacterium]
MSQIEKIHHTLIEKKKTLALAESCSGGNLAAKFISIPDASKYFLGSMVTYSNAMKEKILHVSVETIRVSGAVSREVADEMLIGLMKLSGADYGIATTGIAGPTGGTSEKPVGTVFIAVGAKGKKPHVVQCDFEGDRAAIIEATCERALEELSYLI